MEVGRARAAGLEGRAEPVAAWAADVKVVELVASAVALSADAPVVRMAAVGEVHAEAATVVTVVHECTQPSLRWLGTAHQVLLVAASRILPRWLRRRIQ